MLVLDYPQVASNGSIMIPPFHTGHLGFLPETPIHLYLTHPKRKVVPQYAELLVTPFQRNVGEMMRLSCIMEDKPGVVERLIEAVSDLNINIVTQESAAINHLNHHLVSMVLDLSSCYSPRSKPPRTVLHDYGNYRGLVPLDDSRTVDLFESILTNCADLILWDESSGTTLPRLKIDRIHIQSGIAAEGTATVRSSKNFHVNVEIPRPILTRVCNHLRAKPDDDLRYLILSETEERLLRVFFFKKDFAERIVHLAFYHQDAPRSLSSMLKPIARAKFNIITSLLRKETKEESVWEAVLEYRGKGGLPDAGDLYEWTAKTLAANTGAEDIAGLQDSQITIGKPRYPKRAESRVALSDMLPVYEEVAVKNVDSACYSAALDAQLKHLRENRVPDNDPRVRLLSTIQRRKYGKPVVFLSYPNDAQVHAEVLAAALKPYCEISTGMNSEAQVILDYIVDRIRSADFFVGIWHHDSKFAGQVSPWLPFEYGVALSADKPAVITHSAEVAPAIWKRINPGMNQPSYSDVTFAGETVPKIVDVVRNRLSEVQGPKSLTSMNR